jgi:hypothetical protein
LPRKCARVLDHRPLDQSRPHGIERQPIAQRRRETFLVHDDGADLILPEMTVRLRRAWMTPAWRPYSFCRSAAVPPSRS